MTDEEYLSLREASEEVDRQAEAMNGLVEGTPEWEHRREVLRGRIEELRSRVRYWLDNQDYVDGPGEGGD